jgi:hypothetical protein
VQQPIRTALVALALGVLIVLGALLISSTR